MISAGGPPIPSLDPALTGNLSWAHLTTPQSSAFLTGTNSLIQRQNLANFGIQKGFLTGTTVGLGLNNNSITSNNPRNDFNPSTNSSLALTFTQHLLQGFGTALNSRQIRIAKNNREVSDLTFKLQVETTVAAVMELYWDLVSFNEAVQVARDALAASQQLLENNRKQVEVGTLAPIEVVRAEAEIASRRTDAGGQPDARSAAGDHPEDGAEPHRRGQPGDRGGAHHPHGPDPRSRRGADHADSGSDRAWRSRRAPNWRRAASSLPTRS